MNNNNYMVDDAKAKLLEEYADAKRRCLLERDEALKYLKMLEDNFPRPTKDNLHILVRMALAKEKIKDCVGKLTEQGLK